MLLSLNLESETPIYIQLRNKIIEGIASGELKRGESLPSVRALAQDLSVNMHTINKAYQLLKNDGFIQIHRQKGVVITLDEMPKVTEEYTRNLEENIRPLIAESICRGMEREEFLSICEKLFKEIKKGGGTS